MPTSRVRVRLIAECEVEIDVQHEKDEDPSDLTEEDRTAAQRAAPAFADWKVESAKVTT